MMESAQLQLMADTYEQRQRQLGERGGVSGELGSGVCGVGAAQSRGQLDVSEAAMPQAEGLCSPVANCGHPNQQQTQQQHLLHQSHPQPGNSLNDPHPTSLPLHHSHPYPHLPQSGSDATYLAAAHSGMCHGTQGPTQLRTTSTSTTHTLSGGDAEGGGEHARHVRARLGVAWARWRQLVQSEQALSRTLLEGCRVRRWVDGFDRSEVMCGCVTH